MEIPTATSIYEQANWDADMFKNTGLCVYECLEVEWRTRGRRRKRSQRGGGKEAVSLSYSSSSSFSPSSSCQLRGVGAWLSCRGELAVSFGADKFVVHRHSSLLAHPPCYLHIYYFPLSLPLPVSANWLSDWWTNWLSDSLPCLPPLFLGRDRRICSCYTYPLRILLILPLYLLLSPIFFFYSFYSYSASSASSSFFSLSLLSSSPSSPSLLY